MATMWLQILYSQLFGAVTIIMQSSAWDKREHHQANIPRMRMLLQHTVTVVISLLTFNFVHIVDIVFL